MIDKKAIEESGRRAIRKPTRKETKEHIKTLVENTNVGRMRNTGRIMKYGAASFTRNIWLSIAATLVMTITLIILMITILASMILSATADTMRSKIDITVFFNPGTSEEILTVMSETMQADSNIRSIETTSSEEELANLMEENRDNEALMATFSDPDMYQHMLNTMQATMRIKVYNPDNLDSIRHIVDTNPFFQENLDTEKRPTYDANQAEIATISSWATIAKNGGLILGAVFLVISVLVIFNTIRMAIFSRHEEIYMMKLVGADLSFIRGPFLVEAQICGLISGLLATTFVLIGFRFIAPNLSGYGIDISSVERLFESSMLVAVYGVMIVVGMVIGTVSARLAMHKYLK